MLQARVRLAKAQAQVAKDLHAAQAGAANLKKRIASLISG